MDLRVRRRPRGRISPRAAKAAPGGSFQTEQPAAGPTDVAAPAGPRLGGRRSVTHRTRSAPAHRAHSCRGTRGLSLNTSAIYFGIAAGAALGGRVLTHLGTPQLGLVAAALELAALLVIVAVPNHLHAEDSAESHNGTDRVATASVPVL